MLTHCKTLKGKDIGNSDFTYLFFFFPIISINIRCAFSPLNHLFFLTCTLHCTMLTSANAVYDKGAFNKKKNLI